MKDIILASSSTYRNSLFQKLNLKFTSTSPNIDESQKTNEKPDALALRLAIEKAHALKDQYPNHLIISSDQVASFDGQLLGKPNNHVNNVKQLKLQSGKSVNFFTSLCVLDSASGIYYTDIDLSITHFKVLSEQQILNYLKIDTPYDCAGGFKAEGLGISLFNKIESEDPNSLIGLPLIKLIAILEKFEVHVI